LFVLPQTPPAFGAEQELDMWVSESAFGLASEEELADKNPFYREGALFCLNLKGGMARILFVAGREELTVARMEHGEH
jgi:hypothetical protein